MHKQKWFAYILALIILAGHTYLGYTLERFNHAALFPIYFLLFAVYLWILKKSDEHSIRFWLYVSFAARLCLLFSLPLLSDDFYRFIWDGRLLTQGINPFTELPSYYLSESKSIIGIDNQLFDHLNSQQYYSVYPPLAQFIFWVSVVLSPDSILGSVVIMRLFILAAEIGSIILLWKLTATLNTARKNVLIYALNPLVIIELTGNLHFEAIVIFFVLLTIYLLAQVKIWHAGFAFALAVMAKLLPLVLLPQFFTRLGLRKSFFFYLTVGITCLLVSLPFITNEMINGLGSGLGLYFGKFEFNASIYYIVREYGYLTKGYNIIQSVGWKLALISTLTILLISIWPLRGLGKRILSSPETVLPIEKMATTMVWVLLIYYLLATTVHPWYITSMVAFSALTRYRFAVIWSGLIFLTYSGYHRTGFEENLYLVALEYIVLIAYMVYELFSFRNMKLDAKPAKTA
ncbi:MAG TPA: hypothetical protein PKN99_10325 [Cyclobacteriaceae bacterium]|nr:hypothetical protein [Cyclobacteriaceae bacterium]